MLGTAVGGYRLVAQLGEGGMGAVYLAEHLLLGRRAAIKVLLPELSARHDVVHRFFNEARAVTAVADPGIVQVFDFGHHTDGSAYLVMELLEGEPLDARLRRLGRLHPLDALRIGRQLASSLAAAHARGIVHRDLKPENVFLVLDREVAGGERAKVLDFGIAKLSEDAPSKARTIAGTLLGTPVYMSPEQCRGAGDLDHRSDIYALGCVLYHLLVGRPPFAGDGVGEIIAGHLRESAAPPSALAAGLPPALDAVLLRCLAKAPSDRHGSMDQVAAALGEVLQQLAPGSVSAQHAVPYLAGPTPGPAFTVPPGPPTTLGGSAAAVSAAPARRGWIAAGLLIAAAVALAAYVAVPPTVREAPAPAPAASPPAFVPAVDAAVDAATPPDAASQPDAAMPDAASQPDAATPDAATPDAAPTSRRRARAARQCASDDHDCDGIPDE